MDLQALSSLSLISVFQKMRYDGVIKVRKMCKGVDKFVETHRFEIARNPSPDVDFAITLEKETENTDAEAVFSVSDINNIGFRLTDPYKQLSAVAFRYVFVENLSTMNNLREQELDDILRNGVFPLLKKMRPLCCYFENIGFTTEALFVLAECVRSLKFYVNTKTQYHPDVNLTSIMTNPKVQKSTHFGLKNRWTDDCPKENVMRFTSFSTICLTDVRTTFIMSMIENLYEIGDSGKLNEIVITTSSDLFAIEKPYMEISNSDVLFCMGTNSRNYFVIRLFYGVWKWIVCIYYNNHRSLKNKMTVRIIDQNPSLLLDLLTKTLIAGKVDVPSNFRAEFVNSPSMKQRRKIFTPFALNALRTHNLGNEN